MLRQERGSREREHRQRTVVCRAPLASYLAAEEKVKVSLLESRAWADPRTTPTAIWAAEAQLRRAHDFAEE